jgi:TPR repeat protein
MTTRSAVTVLLAGMLVGAAAAAAPQSDSSKLACKVPRVVSGATQGTAQALQMDADRGSVEAMTALGLLYAQGLGVIKNDCMAMRLFERAAELGFAPAMINLATLYARGGKAQRDDEHAYAWLRAALYVGVPESERDATVFMLGMFAAHLDVAQVRRAEALARRLAAAAVQRRPPAETSATHDVDSDGSPLQPRHAAPAEPTRPRQQRERNGS